MNRHRRAAIAMALTTTLLISACNGDSNDETDPPPLEPSPTTETTAPPTGTAPTTEPPVDTAPTTEPTEDTTPTTEEPILSPEEQDEADVAAAVEGYLAVLDSVAQGEADLSAINLVASEAARDKWMTQHMAYLDRGWTQVDDQVIVSQDVDLDGDSATVNACIDVSGVDVIDEKGDSVVTPERPDTTVLEYVLERSEIPDTGWIVIHDLNLDERCNE